MTLATSLDMNIELCFVDCALESALWQRLSTIKVELEFVSRQTGHDKYSYSQKRYTIANKQDNFQTNITRGDDLTHLLSSFH